MKISDSIETTSGLHVFETPEDLIINSQVYDKFSMEPKPYNFFNINTLANKNLLLHQINILEYNWVNPSKEHDYKYFIQDNQDSSIFYCLLEIGNADPNQYLHKIRKVNNNYELIKSVSPDSGYRNSYDITTRLHYKIIGQTKNYILLIQNTISGSITKPQYGYIGAYYKPPVDGISLETLSYVVVKKSDLSARFINVNNSHQDENVCLIKEKENGIYTFEQINGSIYICYIDTENALRSTLYSNTSYDAINVLGISNIILFQNFYYALTGTVSSGRKFLKFKIDENNKTVTNTAIESISNSSSFALFNKNERDDYKGDSWIRYSLKNIDDTYIQITCHANQNKMNGRQYIQGTTTYAGYFRTWYAYFANTSLSYTLDTNGRHRHFLCKKNNNNQWTIANVIIPSNSQQFIYGVLYLNQYTPIFHLKTGVEIYRLDLETETYAKVFESPGTFQTIGLDENNNFYTFDISNKCQIYNLNSCSNLNGRFEYDTYNYDNEDIETNVTIASKNFIGELISSRIHIELSGNCKFRNGKQEATLNTRLDLEYEVPVIITGPGVVYCNINEVE